MQPFQPGEDYAGPYQMLIWVCLNPMERSFERCDLALSQRVLERFKTLLARQGLSHRVFVIASGCQLGCMARGTSVIINQRQASAPHAWLMHCFKGVTPDDVETLIQQVVHTSPQSRSS